MRTCEARTWVAAALACLGAVACTPAEETVTSSGPAAATVEPVDEQRSRIVLTQRAVERLGLRTAAVAAADAGSAAAAQRVVPYGALLYDAAGDTWAYTAEEGLAFLRQAVTVDRFAGDRVLLTAGPPVGTQVVVAGAAELFGTELDVGH